MDSKLCARVCMCMCMCMCVCVCVWNYREVSFTRDLTPFLPLVFILFSLLSTFLFPFAPKKQTTKHLRTQNPHFTGTPCHNRKGRPFSLAISPEGCENPWDLDLRKDSALFEKTLGIVFVPGHVLIDIVIFSTLISLSLSLSLSLRVSASK